MRRSALALLLGCLLLVAGASALDGYDYYQTIEYAACDQETYQQDIVIHRSTGTAYNETAGGLETWHIFVGEHCREDYGDIRFTNSTGDLAYYLWPDYDSSSARFAVRLEGADAAGEVTAWYGNSSAATTSLPIPLKSSFTDVGDHTFTVPAGISSVGVLIVGGGGGGGGGTGGGGGAGGLIHIDTYAVTPESSIPVTVGAGGTGGSGISSLGTSGGASSFGSLVALGGGGGGGNSRTGANGGSGGGGGHDRTSDSVGLQPSQSGDSGTYGYGNAGRGQTCAAPNYGAGGGGGAGSPGTHGSGTSGGNGGDGKQVWGTYYAGGGGGGTYNGGTLGSGGLGGGGGGGAGAGTPATGGGGGGQKNNDGSPGGAGGSGIVVVCIGTPYAVTPPAALTFSGEQASSGLRPFPGLTPYPRDLNSDGLYTDINGNNRLDYNDLTVFFQHLAWAKANQPTECFDFNGNGWLDYNDVITLFTTISGEHP